MKSNNKNNHKQSSNTIIAYNHRALITPIHSGHWSHALAPDICQRLCAHKNWMCPGTLKTHLCDYAYQAWSKVDQVCSTTWSRLGKKWSIMKHHDQSWNAMINHCLRELFPVYCSTSCATICQETCLGGVPRGLGYCPKPLIHTLLYSGGKFWVAQRRHLGFSTLCISWSKFWSLNILWTWQSEFSLSKM